MTEIIAIAAIVIVAWFAAGTAWNIQRGRLAMRWMQTGLRVLGERTTVRWLGSTAVEMFIRAGNAPFASVTLITFLEARDIPWVWVLGRARGRRDILIIRGVLRRVPHLEFEALQPPVGPAVKLSVGCHRNGRRTLVAMRATSPCTVLMRPPLGGRVSC